MAIVDFGIVAALPEEFEILLALFPDAEQVTGKFTWYRTRTKSKDGRNYELVFAHQFGMGPLDAHHLAESLIARWDPAHILLVGIAGSFHDQVRLGDVIVSQQVFYFDPGKYADGEIRYRPEGYPCSVALVRQVYAVSVAAKEFSAWQKAGTKSAAKKAKKLPSKYQDEKKKNPKFKIPTAKSAAAAERALAAHAPRIHVGSLASGSLVIADEEKKTELLQLHGKLLGTEMEGAGILHAAFYYGDSPRSAIVLKGVSDSADANKAQLDGLDFWRKLAGENSVRLAMAIIHRGVLTPTLADQFTVDMTFSDPAEVRQVIKTNAVPPAGFIGFPALVRPKGPLTKLSIRVSASSQGTPINAAEALILSHRDGRLVKEDLAPGHPVTFESEETFDPEPIGFYMLTIQPVDVIEVAVSGPGLNVTQQWRLSLNP